MIEGDTGGKEIPRREYGAPMLALQGHRREHLCEPIMQLARDPVALFEHRDSRGLRNQATVGEGKGKHVRHWREQ